jgi:hypothetical protein
MEGAQAWRARHGLETEQKTRRETNPEVFDNRSSRRRPSSRIPYRVYGLVSATYCHWFWFLRPQTVSLLQCVLSAEDTCALGTQAILSYFGRLLHSVSFPSLALCLTQLHGLYMQASLELFQDTSFHSRIHNKMIYASGYHCTSLISAFINTRQYSMLVAICHDRIDVKSAVHRRDKHDYASFNTSITEHGVYEETGLRSCIAPT